MLSSACGSVPMRVAAMDDVERVRGGADAQEGAKVAPEAYARAEQERRIAISAHAAGDDVAATLHAQRALAAYTHALVVGRLARAATEQADAQKALDDTTTQAQTIEASRAQLEQNVQELEQRLRIARDRLMPAASATAPAEREAARQVAVRSMVVEARLLCDAAQLVAADAAGSAGLSDAIADVAKLEDRVSKGASPAPIDDAARGRARCLDVLTRARRTAGDDAGAADTLLAELSASGGWAPARDERGVVVTLHDAFQGAALSTDATARLKELGQVAAAHPGFAVQVVVHDAQPPRAKDATDGKRADAATQALVSGGAASGKLQTELAGARAPLVDPADAKARGRNERLDIVFIASAR
jgi:outer membrane protein OmpA-like peptidoglycan-associated protein